MKSRKKSVLSARLQELHARGVDTVRVTYSDIHGVARGKDVPLDWFEVAISEGLAFCCANLVDGLALNLANLPARPAEPAYPDLRVLPLPETLAQLPWEKPTAWCIGRVDPNDPQSSRSPRNALERAVAAFEAMGLTPIAAVELEFYLLLRDAAGRLVPVEHAPNMAYTMGQRADPTGIIRGLLRQAQEVGLGAIAAQHECGRGQYEINLNHSEALDAADRGFRLKHTVKELAHRQNLLATFMGKPFADDAASGLHLHLSLQEENGNRFFDPAGKNQLSPLARHFLAGILAHAPALTAFGSPTINSYKRLVPGTLVPVAANWGWDNRTTYVRIPAARKKGTRLELRAADAAANPYLVLSANLLAGLDGIKRRLEPPPPLLDGTSSGSPLPRSLEESLQALRQDAYLSDAVGKPLVDAFCAVKAVEIERYRLHISEWEMSEYAWHL